MLKGLTVQYLFRQTYKLKAGDTILFHAAAGGVGLIACQWARALGVTMIGTVGSDEKAALAKANGCTHTIVYTRENFVERVKELTGGKGVPVVYDGVGKDTFPASLDCLSPRGLWVSFGNASGAVPPFDIMLLSQKGSLYVTRPTLFTLHGEARGPDRDGRRDVRSRAGRQDRQRAAADLRAEGCGGGAPRARIARDDRRDGAAALSGVSVLSSARVEQRARGASSRAVRPSGPWPRATQRVRRRAVQADGEAQRGLRVDSLREERAGESRRARRRCRRSRGPGCRWR